VEVEGMEGVNERADAKLNFYDPSFRRLQLRMAQDGEGNAVVPESYIDAVKQIKTIVGEKYYRYLMEYYGLTYRGLKQSRRVRWRFASRNYDIGQFLFDAWKLNSSSKLSKQFACMGNKYGDFTTYFLASVIAEDEKSEGLYFRREMEEAVTVTKQLLSVCNDNYWELYQS
jgi:hypothetical protein